jgi:hypothetical protein
MSEHWEESMLSRARNKLGTAGLVVAVCALVAALAGGAYAASGALTSKQKREVTSIAKKFAGKAGATGPQGLPGANGTNGTNGSPGAPGAPGAAGKSVVLSAVSPGAECADGGTKVEVEGNSASKKFVCNGTTGFTETLPSGQTEAGAWSYGITASTVSLATSSISFNMALPAGTLPAFHYIKTDGEDETDCPGNDEEPDAAKGNLCVYLGEVVENPGTISTELTSFTFNHSGISLVFNTPQIEGTIPAEFKPSLASGTWAVTPK